MYPPLLQQMGKMWLVNTARAISWHCATLDRSEGSDESWTGLMDLVIIIIFSPYCCTSIVFCKSNPLHFPSSRKTATYDSWTSLHGLVNHNIFLFSFFHLATLFEFFPRNHSIAAFVEKIMAVKLDGVIIIDFIVTKMTSIFFWILFFFWFCRFYRYVFFSWISMKHHIDRSAHCILLDSYHWEPTGHLKCSADQ